MRHLKDHKITLVQVAERYQDEVGAWHDGEKVETVVWANLAGAKHSSYMAAHAEVEQPSLLATFTLPRGYDLCPGDTIIAAGKRFEVSHVDFLDMTGEVKAWLVDRGSE